MESKYFKNCFIIRMENLLALMVCLCLYAQCDFSWLVFICAFFIPDISMFGYLINAKVGSRMYNLCHTYIWALVLGMFGLLSGRAIFIQVCLIWIAHISMDRVLGYGLKYAAGFKETTLQKI